MLKKSLAQWIAEANEKHEGIYDYSLVEYKGAHVPVEIICRFHGSFFQDPSNHRRGSGCSDCQNKLKADEKRSSTEEWIEKARAVHEDTYDYSKVNYTGRHSKVVIICEHHGDFEQTPGNHLKPNGCPQCAKEVRGNKRAYTPEQWKAKATEKYIGKYDYSQTKYTRSNQKVTILCRMHGAFQLLPANHLFGQECPKCQKDIQDQAKRDTTASFIEKANKAHHYKYEYSQVEYVLSTERVLIGCPVPEHGFYWQKPVVHVQGYGCPKCGVAAVAASKYSNTEEWVEKAKLVHRSLQYDYSRVHYKSAKEQVEIGCPSHGFFWQIADNHLQGRRCPKCTSSVGEVAIEDYLQSRNVAFEREVRFDDCRDAAPLPFDFMVKLDGRTYAIEFHGIQHYRPVRFSYSISGEQANINLVACQKRDAIKEVWCRVKNIPLLVIPYQNIEDTPNMINFFLGLNDSSTHYGLKEVINE